MSLSDRFGTIEKETRDKKASDLLRKKTETPAKTGPAKKKQDASLGRAAKAVVGAAETAPARVQKRRGGAKAAGEQPAKPAASNGRQQQQKKAAPAKGAAQQKQQPAKKGDAAPKKGGKKGKAAAKPAPKPTAADLDAEMERYAAKNPAYAAARLDSELDRYRKEAAEKSAETKASDAKPAAE